MKKITIVILLAAIFLSGCGKSSPEVETTTEATDENSLGYLDEAIDKSPDEVKYSIDLCEAIPNDDTLFVNIKVKYRENMGEVAEYITEVVSEPSDDYSKSDIMLRYTYEDESVCTWHCKDNKTGQFIDTSKEFNDPEYCKENVSVNDLKQLVK